MRARVGRAGCLVGVGAVCEWRVGDVVDGELPPPRVDVVYYLRQGDRVKIGTTDRFAGSGWFRMSPGLAAHIASVAAGVDDPWDLHARWISEALALRG